MGKLAEHKLPDDSAHLCEEHAHEFDKWWDSEKYDWEHASWALAQYCHQYFELWWDPERYNWKVGSWALAQYCHQYFGRWWDPDKFNWKNGSVELAEHYFRYFQKSWDSERHTLERGVEYLVTYCDKQIDKWLMDLIERDKIVKHIILALKPELLRYIQLHYKLTKE